METQKRLIDANVLIKQLQEQEVLPQLRRKDGFAKHYSPEPIIRDKIVP